MPSDAGEDVVLAAQLRREKGEIFRLRKNMTQAARLFGEARDIYKRVGATPQAVALDRMIAGLGAATTASPRADASPTS